MTAIQQQLYICRDVACSGSRNAPRSGHWCRLQRRAAIYHFQVSNNGYFQKTVGGVLLAFDLGCVFCGPAFSHLGWVAARWLSANNAYARPHRQTEISPLWESLSWLPGPCLKLN